MLIGQREVSVSHVRQGVSSKSGQCADKPLQANVISNSSGGNLLFRELGFEPGSHGFDAG